ncbi:MAG: saccharopine dehydrogenase NADP-binding domain-containing protein [Cyclobacteriaceae bacterium]|nr:saccharopine dehydrogenase NADP-binding domain-containing protein [Cyclobacteriaceae bacterium]
MSRKIIVLGAGLVGSAIAKDLAKDFEVTSVDINQASLDGLKGIPNLTPLLADFSNHENLLKLVEPFDLVVGAVPGFMGFKTAETVIEAGKNMVDISFFPEDPFLLDEKAKAKGVTIITDCGVAPGMGNIILGYHNQQMKVDKYTCLVGGLPKVREWPYEYRAVFSPIDVIEEYIRPARYVQDGHMVVREALSDPELIQFDKIGTLESWNSDGLRSLVDTMPHIPNMIEKTLRYPGTIEYLRVLRETGFFSYDEVEVSGNAIRPIDLTAKLLFPKWKLKPGEEEFTVMKINIKGEKEGKSEEVEYYLYDEYEKETGIISMARTTGYTCTAAVNLLDKGLFDRKGICPPEYLGEKEENFKFVLQYLADRGVIYQVKTIN